MSSADRLRELPENLPHPVDDDACAHLEGTTLPSQALVATRGEPVNLAAVAGTSIVYCHPMIGRPDVELPDGWDDFPGARGCTVQSLAYSDRLDELLELNVSVFGMSFQHPQEQREASERLGLRQVLLSDYEQTLTDRVGLPTFELGGKHYLRRCTLAVSDGRIERVWYPVFPPGQDTTDVLVWLRSRLS